MAQQKNTDKYTKLAGNTILFAISSFSAKLLSILIRPFVTNVLQDPEIVGVTTLTTQCANLLIPLVSMGITTAIICFGLEKQHSKQAVFTNGLLTIGCGYLGLLLLYPLVRLIPSVSGYIGYLYIYVLTSCLRTLCTSFVRSRQHNYLAAIDGVLCTFVTLMLYAVFLLKFQMGAAGYLLAIICADCFSALFLFCYEKLWRYLDFSKIDRVLWRKMVLVALPMIPAQISFWVINAADLFFVQALADGRDGLSGEYWVGVLSVAYYLPTILSTIGIIFYEAWQLSSITETQGRGAFYSKVFQTYSGLLFCVAAGIIWLNPILMNIFLDEFYIAWRYVPFLAIAAMITCFNQFFNSIYVAYHHTMGSCITMLVGAVANCVMNFIFVPLWGAAGAAFASMLSLAIVFVFRAVNTRQFLAIAFAKTKFGLSFALLLLETTLFLCNVPFAFWYAALITAVMICSNWASVWAMFALLAGKVLGRRGKAMVAFLEQKGRAITGKLLHKK